MVFILFCLVSIHVHFIQSLRCWWGDFYVVHSKHVNRYIYLVRLHIANDCESTMFSFSICSKKNWIVWIWALTFGGGSIQVTFDVKNPSLVSSLCTKYQHQWQEWKCSLTAIWNWVNMLFDMLCSPMEKQQMTKIT